MFRLFISLPQDKLNVYKIGGKVALLGTHFYLCKLFSNSKKISFSYLLAHGYIFAHYLLNYSDIES